MILQVLDQIFLVHAHWSVHQGRGAIIISRSLILDTCCFQLLQVLPIENFLVASGIRLTEEVVICSSHVVCTRQGCVDNLRSVDCGHTWVGRAFFSFLKDLLCFPV